MKRKSFAIFRNRKYTCKFLVFFQKIAKFSHFHCFLWKSFWQNCLVNLSWFLIGGQFLFWPGSPNPKKSKEPSPSVRTEEKRRTSSYALCDYRNYDLRNFSLSLIKYWQLVSEMRTRRWSFPSKLQHRFYISKVSDPCVCLCCEVGWDQLVAIPRIRDRYNKTCVFGNSHISDQ